MLAVARIVGDRRAVALLVLRQQRRDTADGSLEVAVGEEREQTRDLEDVLDLGALVRGGVADREHRELGAVVAGALGRGHLHRLLLEHELGLDVAGDRDAGEGDDAGDRSDPQRGDPHLVVDLVASGNVRSAADDDLAVGSDGVDAVLAPTVEVVPRDADEEAAADGEGAEEGVGVGRDRGVVAEHRPDIGHHGLAVDEFDADGVLHPRVRDDDEER
ncbi:Uncharacterised protein [Mycobacteroides abscessus subsp. abscessus]|nr:Uncharacterised protein [Mycobacteroides abscessus subsp. abscessus]